MHDEQQISFSNAIAALRPEGQREYAWIRQLGGDSVDDALPLVLRTCELAQRISDTWKLIDKQGLVNGRGQKNPLLGTVIQLEKTYTQNWKALGLSDKDTEGHGRIGRPPGGGGSKDMFR